MRVTPRKARLIAAEVRGKSAIMAAAQLQYHPSKAAFHMRKVLMSAVANAINTDKMDAESLVVSRIDVDEGFRMKRIRARAQGRANRILKRTSHITIVLREGEPFEIKKSNASPKPRPKFDTKKKKAKDEPKAEEPEAVTQAAEETVEETVVEAEAAAEETAVAETETEAAAEETPEAPAEEDAEATEEEEGKQE